MGRGSSGGLQLWRITMVCGGGGRSGLLKEDQLRRWTLNAPLNINLGCLEPE